MPEFEFVVSDGSSTKRPTAALRSHAVKSGLQRKNQVAAGGDTGVKHSQLTIRQKDSLKGRFRLTDGKGKGKGKGQGKKGSKADSKQSKEDASSAQPAGLKLQVQIIKSPAQGRDDPFNTFPVSLAGDVHNLVRFYVSRFELPVPIATIQKQWWEYAQTDTLLMHSTLSVSAAMWGATARLPPIIVKEGWRQKGLALRGVQEKLDQGDGSMTLVGTIGNLANLEGVEGNFQVARLHLQGLDRIVRKWPDGYKAIQSNVNVARTINWADIQAATGLGMKPLLPLVFSLDSVVLPLSILTAAEQPSLHHLEEFERSCNNTAVRFCFSLTRQSVIAARHKEVAGDDFRILMNSADHFISTTLGGDSLTELGRALVTAASVSYYALVRQVPLRALLPRILVRRLHKQLDLSMDEFRSNPTYHPGLIWALLVGAAASYETREGFDFFSSNLLMMLIIGNIHKRADLEALAKRFIFHDNFPGSFFRQYGTSLFPQTIERA